MDLNRIVMMIVRRLLSHGIRSGIGMASNRNRPPANKTAQERAQDRQGKAQGKAAGRNASMMFRLGRRFGRF